MVRPYVVLPFVLFTTSVVWRSIQGERVDVLPCSSSSCETECGTLGFTYGENVTMTHQCNKATGQCGCCILPRCEQTCQQRRKKERPRSTEVRSRCTDKGECYCNFIFFQEPLSTPKASV